MIVVGETRASPANPARYVRAQWTSDKERGGKKSRKHPWIFRAEGSHSTSNVHRKHKIPFEKEAEEEEEEEVGGGDHSAEQEALKVVQLSWLDLQYKSDVRAAIPWARRDFVFLRPGRACCVPQWQRIGALFVSFQVVGQRLVVVVEHRPSTPFDPLNWTGFEGFTQIKLHQRRNSIKCEWNEKSNSGDVWSFKYDCALFTCWC